MLSFVASLLVIYPSPGDTILRQPQSGYQPIFIRASEFAPSHQYDASISLTGAGFAIAWESRRQLEGLPGVFCREFDKVGRPLCDERRASTAAASPESKPQATPNGAVFEAFGRDGSGSGVFVGSRSASRTPFGHQFDPVAASTGSGLIVAWASQVRKDRWVILARRISPSGAPVGAEIRVSGREGVSERLPTIAAYGSSFVVAWQESSLDGSPSGLWVRRFHTDGSAIAPAVNVVGPNAVEPSIAMAGDRIALAWNEARGADGYQVRARNLSLDLRPLGKVLDAPKARGDQNGAAVAVGRDGGFVLGWNQRSPSQRRALIQVFSADGRRVTRPMSVSPMAGLDSSFAEATGRTRLVLGSDGRIAVAWHGDTGLGDSVSANLTVFVPVSRISASELREISLNSNRGAANEPEAATSHQATRFVTETADPHQPPRFRLKDRDPFRDRFDAGDGGGFTAITSTGWTPPDPHHAVGPNHIVAITNGEIAFFTKAGVNTFRDEIEDAFGFWGSLGTGGFVFDPEAIWDPHAGRFMAMACERTGGQSYYLLAVSDDGDPNGTWHKYRFNVTALAGGDIDSPNLAVDSQAVYLTADFFTGGQKYLVYILRKVDVLSGIPPLTTSHLITGTQSHGLPLTWDAAAPAQYLIEHFEAATNTAVRLHAITNPLGSPTRTMFTLTVPSYAPPEDPPQAGSTVRPETFDSRFWSCVYRDGMLWATHHVNSTQVRARWYQIAMNGWPGSGNNPTLVQSGEVVPGTGIRTFFSSISVDSVGNACVVAARSSPSEQFSMYRAIRKETDALGTMPDGAIVKGSLGPYGTGRWGDYSGCVTDPADGRTFWGHHEYSENGTWFTWIDSFVAGVNSRVLGPQAFLVFAGQHVGGDLNSLRASDDGWLLVREGPPISALSPSAGLIVETVSPTSNILSVALTWEGRCAAAPSTLIDQIIEMFNYQSNTWEVVDTRHPTQSDSTIQVTPAGDPKRFVQAGTKAMKMRIGWYDRGAATLGWTCDTDLVAWTVQY